MIGQEEITRPEADQIRAISATEIDFSDPRILALTAADIRRELTRAEKEFITASSPWALDEIRAVQAKGYLKVNPEAKLILENLKTELEAFFVFQTELLLNPIITDQQLFYYESTDDFYDRMRAYVQTQCIQLNYGEKIPISAALALGFDDFVEYARLGDPNAQEVFIPGFPLIWDLRKLQAADPLFLLPATPEDCQFDHILALFLYKDYSLGNFQALSLEGHFFKHLVNYCVFGNKDEKGACRFLYDSTYKKRMDRLLQQLNYDKWKADRERLIEREIAGLKSPKRRERKIARDLLQWNKEQDAKILKTPQSKERRLALERRKQRTLEANYDQNIETIRQRKIAKLNRDIAKADRELAADDPRRETAIRELKKRLAASLEVANKLLERGDQDNAVSGRIQSVPVIYGTPEGTLTLEGNALGICAPLESLALSQYGFDEARFLARSVDRAIRDQ